MECPKFVGSSYAWHIDDNDEATDALKGSREDIVNRDNNIIPKEITEKIIDSILVRKDDFKVFHLGYYQKFIKFSQNLVFIE